MVCLDVTFQLDCDTCDFNLTVDAENTAYVSAKEHESDHPTHFVLIRSAE